MARGGAEALFKKNNKLESYLKRTLTDETFERVRAYESCIIVSEKENKAFKYVILGDEWIYLTENPPKSLQEAVSLKDIVSVELVNDYPDFLSGEERENTQHLAVTYWTVDGKRRSIRKSRKSPRGGSDADLHGNRSNASTPLGYISSQESGIWSVEDGGIASQSISSLQITRPDSRGSVGSNRESSKSSSIKKKKNRLADSLDETILKSLKEESEEQGLEDIEENDALCVSSEVKTVPKRDLPNTKTRKKSSTDTSSQKGDSTSQTGSVKSLRPLPQGSRKTAFESPSSTNVVNGFNEKPPIIDENEHTVGTVDVYEEEKPIFCCSALNCLNGKNRILPFCGRNNKDPIDNDIKSNPPQDFPIIEAPLKADPPPPPEITVDIKSDISSRPIQRGSISSLQDGPNSRRSSITTLKGPPSRVGTPALESEPTFTRSVSNLGMASYSDLGGSVNGLSVSGHEFGLSERRKAVLNIYLLNLHSPMLMLIRSAWSNYLIRCTLMLDPEYEKVFKSSVVRSGPQSQREKMEVLFGQLKRELFNPENQMDDTFNLLNELRVATERNFALKKMFWKNSDMFLFLVKQLQRYLPKSPININTDHGRLQRVDEFELVILLTDILSLMFRESEIIPARIQTLKAERGRSVLDLLMVLTCTPEVPEKFSAPTIGTVSIAGSFKGGDVMAVNTDKEIENQLTQFTKTALMAVYELFLMAKQANWGYSEGNFFNIGWLVKVLEEIRTTEMFVDRVIQQMMKLIGPARKEALDPVEGVLLYMQFSVLQTFLQYSPRVAGFIRSNYFEEFKYFVQVPVIVKKVPSNFPVINITMPLIESVMNKVLEKHTLTYPKSPRS